MTTSKSIESVVVEGRTFIRHEIETQTDEGEPVTVIGFGCNAKEGSLLLMAAIISENQRASVAKNAFASICKFTAPNATFQSP